MAGVLLSVHTLPCHADSLVLSEQCCVAASSCDADRRESRQHRCSQQCDT